jgi:hypothetical protein
VNGLHLTHQLGHFDEDPGVVEENLPELRFGHCQSGCVTLIFTTLLFENWSKTMPDYRIYSLDEGGHIVHPPAVINCANDGEAIDYAEALSGGQLLEVWEKDRRVGRIEPIAPGPAAMIGTEPNQPRTESELL